VSAVYSQKYFFTYIKLMIYGVTRPLIIMRTAYFTPFLYLRQ